MSKSPFPFAGLVLLACELKKTIGLIIAVLAVALLIIFGRKK